MLHDSQHTAKLKKNPFNWTVILSKSESDVLKHVNVYEQISVQFFPFKMKKIAAIKTRSYECVCFNVTSNSFKNT